MPKKPVVGIVIQYYDMYLEFLEIHKNIEQEKAAEEAEKLAWKKEKETLAEESKSSPTVLTNPFAPLPPLEKKMQRLAVSQSIGIPLSPEFEELAASEEYAEYIKARPGINDYNPDLAKIMSVKKGTF